jgi:L-serine dehydratase
MISAFDLFTIGIGPSSSHTVGPMRAAKRFVDRLVDEGQIDRVAAVEVELYGSLGATGKGHGSGKAILGGLSGCTPETVEPEDLERLLGEIRSTSRIRLNGSHEIAFDEASQLRFCRKTLPFHSNGMKFFAFDGERNCLLEATFYSVGGGFVVNEGGTIADDAAGLDAGCPYPFRSCAELLRLCDEHGLSISALTLENEKTLRSETEIRDGLLRIWHAMQQCVERGCANEGTLPGGLKVRRRAADLYRRLSQENDTSAPLAAMDWVDMWALAVNEENAAGGRVVTAPTNGAAGIIPAALHYYQRFCPGADDDGEVRFLLTAAAIGILFKTNASISGAEVGCQGEVGSACSMAAAGLTEVLGGTPQQVENAAEIGMEHNLGLTCDPVGGLVQIPCIERNAMAAVKAINASRMALRGDGRHFVSLDKVIKTMRDTGADMKTKYKETSRGGLAVNVIEC